MPSVSAYRWMEHHHPEFFEHARTLIEPALAKRGFALAEEHYHQRSFGSAIAVYWRRGGELRLIWDGKEEALTANYQTEAEDATRWLAPPVRTSAEIQQLVDAIVATLG